MKNIHPFIFILLLNICCAACHNRSANDNPLKVDSSASAKAADTSVVTAEFPTDTGSSVQVLLPSTYHSDELSGVENGSQWLGLFKGANGFYLAQTAIQKKSVHDDVVDADSVNTGWLVETSITDSCLLLVPHTLLAPANQIEIVPIKNEALMHPQNWSFNYKGAQYRLYTTGQAYQENGIDVVRNYRLFADITQNGTTQTSLLMSTAGFNETITQILFAGDLNGDGLVDFILNTSTHYNMFKPTLYLSNSQRAPWIMPIGWHISVGC